MCLILFAWHTHPRYTLVVDENTYQWDPYSFTGLEKRTSAVTNEVVKEFNARHGTNVQPVLSNIPFKN